MNSKLFFKVPRIALSFLSLVSFSAVAALAETPPSCRICVVDVQKVIETSKVGVAVKKKFKSKVEKAQANMQKRKSEIMSMEKSLQKEVPLLSAEALTKKKRALRDEQQDLQDDMQAVQRELAMGKNEALRSVITQVQETLSDWGDEGFKGLVLESDPRFIVYASKSVDVSTLVKESMDERYKP